MAHNMTPLKIIEQSAWRIYDTQPDATVRIRLLRDVLRLPAQDKALLNAQQDVIKSLWVQALAQEHLCFCWQRRVAKDAVEWLWAQRNAQKLWDFGPRWSASATLPLSESWRNPRHRQNDHSTRALILLRRYYDPR